VAEGEGGGLGELEYADVQDEKEDEEYADRVVDDDDDDDGVETEVAVDDNEEETVKFEGEGEEYIAVEREDVEEDGGIKALARPIFGVTDTP
jgi:hypothetical protein